MTAVKWRSAGGAAAVAAGAAVTGAVALMLSTQACRPSGPPSLAEVLTEYRPFVARLSIGGAHRPCTTEPPFCEPPPRPGDDRFAEIAALAARSASAGDESPEHLHRQGVAALLLGGSSAERAAELLERAQAAAPGDPRILVDLAVAHWVRAESEDDLRWRLAALELLDEALELDPDSPAALFDRALVLGSLPPLREEAREAWHRVEAVVGEGAWQREGAEYRQVLERPTGREEWERLLERLESALEEGVPVDPAAVPDRFSQQVRLWLEDRLLPAWGAAVEAGDQALAARRLELVRDLAALPIRRGAGRTLSQTLDLIDSAADHPTRWLDLARAHSAYGEARSAHERQAYSEAAEPFARAAELFARHGSPFAAWPRFYLVYAKAYAEPPDYEAALHDLDVLRREVSGEDPVVAGYVDWMISYVLNYRRELVASLQALHEAAGSFERAGEEENLAAMHGEAAVRLRRLGRSSEAWLSHDRGLALFDGLVKSRRRQNLMTGLVNQLREEGELRLALYFLDVWVSEAERSGNGVSRVLAYSARAQALARLARPAEALGDLRLAVAASEEISDEGARSFIRFDVVMEEADVLSGAGDFDAALAAMGRARSFIARAEAPLELVDVLRRQAAIQRRQGRTEDALTSLAEAEEEVFRLRPRLDEAGQRIDYLDRLRVVMEDAVELLLAEGRTGEALAVAERMRAPELTAALRRLAGKDRRIDPPMPEDFAPDTAVVAYVSFPERLGVWTLADSRLEVTTLPLSRRRLAAEVAAVVADLRAARGRRYEPGEAARRLAALLLPEGLLDGRRRVLIVPDGPLHGLPFAALPDPGDLSRLILERAALGTTPSLTVARLLERLDRPVASPSALLVEVPTWDQARFPELGPLRARGAAASLNGSFSSIIELGGRDATVAALLREYPRHALVYFAGHSLASTVESSRAGLVLAPAGDDDGLLEPHEIVFAEMPTTRLLVLGSCSGAGGRLSPTEGPLSLVRPFLAAGTPAVIASLGPVEEDAAHALFAELAQGDGGTEDPVELLRRAQVDLLRQRPEISAGVLLFQLYGSAGGGFPDPPLQGGDDGR